MAIPFAIALKNLLSLPTCLLATRMPCGIPGKRQAVNKLQANELYSQRFTVAEIVHSLGSQKALEAGFAACVRPSSVDGREARALHYVYKPIGMSDTVNLFTFWEATCCHGSTNDTQLPLSQFASMRRFQKRKGGVMPGGGLQDFGCDFTGEARGI